jgi:hypothetical protein
MRGSRRGSAREEVLGRGPAAPATRARAAQQQTSAPAATQGPATKIIVSNLPQDVNEEQIKVHWLWPIVFGDNTHSFAHIGTFHRHRRSTP